MTPPFGYNLFLMRAMAPKEITLSDIYISIIPFVLVMLVGLSLVILALILQRYCLFFQKIVRGCKQANAKQKIA
jgi:TRAP-type mannitol/chloroaromatic compound transport system permease large subunit